MNTVTKNKTTVVELNFSFINVVTTIIVLADFSSFIPKMPSLKTAGEGNPV